MIYKIVVRQSVKLTNGEYETAFKLLDIVVIAIKTYDMVVIASKTICSECKNPDKAEETAIQHQIIHQQIVGIFRVHPY